jgi:decaprenyl-phosphate phosphoribosyltransferase
VLVVSCAAVFVATGKRQSEQARVDGARRRVLAAYSPRILRLMLTGSAAIALFAYCVWAFELPAVHGIPWRPLTIIPFAACLVRYHRLVLSGDAEAPEDVLLQDRWLQFAGGAWLVLFALGVHAAG